MTIKTITRQYISTLMTTVVILDFRLKKIDEMRNYPLGEIKHNDLMSEKYKKCVGLWITLNVFLFSFLLSVISAFTSLVGIPVDILSSEVGIKIFVTTAGIKN